MIKSLLLITATLIFNPLMAMEEGDNYVPQPQQLNQVMEWRDLPTEIRCQIFAMVPARDHVTIAGLDKESHNIAEDEVVWHQRVGLEFLAYTGTPKSYETWKRHYKKLKDDQAEVRNQILTQVKFLEDNNVINGVIEVSAKPESGFLLSALPEDIGNIIPNKYEVLYLSSQEFTYLPDSIANLTKLKRLNLHVNKFKDFPDVISNLLDLEAISIGGNNLKFLPDWLVNLKKLKDLFITNNSTLDPASVINFLKKAPVAITISLDSKQYERIASNPQYQEIRESYSENFFSGLVNIVRNKEHLGKGAGQ